MFLVRSAVSCILSNPSSTNSAHLLLSSFVRTLTGANDSVFNYPRKNRTRIEKKIPFRKAQGLPSFGQSAFQDKKKQEWDEWDGFGPYKFKPHYMPNNITQRDVQRRRILKLHAEERLRVNCIRKADVLPSEIRKIADTEIHEVPRASSITNVNRRCTVTGRARGIFHQYRVSRFIFRAEADYNRLSGVQRAKWLINTKIDP